MSFEADEEELRDAVKRGDVEFVLAAYRYKGTERNQMGDMSDAGISQYFQEKPKGRKSWDDYFMDIAKQVSTRATCPRKHVGAVIVRDKTILSTGYNSAIRGAEHCEDVGCMMEDGHCVRVVHAEANAIIQSAKNGVMVDGASIYTLASPCWPCFKLIANAGLKRIVYREFYRDERIFEAARLAGIELVHFNGEVKT